MQHSGMVRPFKNSPDLMRKSLSVFALFVCLSLQALVHAAVVDVFVATGQSNAAWPWDSENQVGTFQFGVGVQDALDASGLFSNPTVVIGGVPGQEIAAWYNDSGANGLYNTEFFDTTAVGTGALEAKIAEIIGNGDTPRFRGVFWFQGEADGLNGTEASYTSRWNGLLGQLASDVGSNDFNYVMNRVGNSGTLINDTLAAITNADARGALFDTQVAPYRTNTADIHGYDHYAVGQANAQLFIDTFVRPVDIFIVAGQSNANGQGLVSELTVPQSTQDAMFYSSWHLQAFNAESTQYYTNWLAQTVAGQTRSTGNVSSTFGNSSWFGPEVGFVARANEINLTANPMGILKYAVDGSALTSDVNFSDWDLSAATLNDGDCWRGFQAALSDAVTKLQNDGHTPNFKGMIWWQGENGTNATDLNAFVAAVRSHLASNYGIQNESEFPIVITGNDFWGAGLKAGVSDLDDAVGFIDSVTYGQIAGYTNVHLGSGQGGNLTDVTGNGINDMYDIGVAYADEMAVLLSAAVTPPPSGPDVSWDGGAGDGLWTSEVNWSGDALPASGDTIEISNGDTVDMPANFFAPTNSTTDVSGGSQLTNSGAAARLTSGAVINFASGSGLSGAYIDLNSGTINFVDGATLTVANIQHRGDVTYGITFSSNGFATLTPGALHDAGNEDWSNVTFNLDFANYDSANGAVVELIDYTGHATVYNGSFNPTVNVEAGDTGLTGTLSFDTASSKVIYTFNSAPTPPPSGPDVSWDGGAGDGLWTSELNWSGNALPASGDTIEISNGDTVDMPADDWSLATGVTIHVTGNSQIDSSMGAARLHSGMVFNFSAGSGIGGQWIHFENCTFNFEDGATFTPGTVQHRFNATYGITFSSTGFTTLTPGELKVWDTEDWSNVTFNIELSEYDTSNGLVVELIDFAGHADVFNGSFNPTINVEAGDSGLTGTLSFDTTNSKVIYTFDGVVMPTTYEITFINVDDSESTVTVNENEVATPPTGVDTAERTFTNWPTVVPATADATYTALYTVNPAVADVTWDGGAGDGLWTSNNNWSGDVAPTDSDSVFVGAPASVTGATTDFDSLEIGAGATVRLAEYFPYSQIFVIHGVLGSDNPYTVLRPYSCDLSLSSSGSIGANITWIDLGSNARLRFEDGASFASAATLQLGGATTFDFALSESGFETLELGTLANNNGGTVVWADVTFNVDVSAYDTSNGLSIVLMDFNSQGANFDGSFDPTVNIIDGGTGIGAVLSYNASTFELILTIDPAGNDKPVALDKSYEFDGSSAVAVALTGSDIDGDTLSFEVVNGPANGVLSGTPPNLTYAFNGSSPDHDSFTFRVNDGELDSDNVATASIVYTPHSTPELWGWLQTRIENEDTLNAATVTTWTEPHSDGSGDTITISRVTYDLGELVGTQHTATPVIAAYYARPTGGTNLPGLLQNHGGGQRAESVIAKFWAEQGYAAICMNWGGLNLQAANPNEPAPAQGQLHPNTNWDGVAGGFSRISTVNEPIANPVTEAIFWASVDPAVFSDGQTLFDIPHPLNSSWVLNGYAARRAITFLQSQPEVNDAKIGVLGWSMGGRTTMMSSTDPRITVLGPSVGGTGYLFDDFWGLPNTARNASGWQDRDLFDRTVDDQSYWPHVSAPVLFLNASNDFNAPFDLATKTLSIHETELNDVSPTNILVADPHYNHRVTDPALAARVVWMRHYLHGDVQYPEISDAELALVTADGVPLFKVYPDTSTLYPIVSVDIYYGSDRDSRTRFWRDAGAVDKGTHWEAPLPIFDAEEMLVAHAVITYDLGFNQNVPFGLPTNLMTVASKVHTYYPTGVDSTGYTFPQELDTDVHQIHLHDSAALVANGLRETAEISDVIDDPSSSRGFKDWYMINGTNPANWQFYTRKISDVCYQGGAGAQLTFDLTADAANTLWIKIVADGWDENESTTYYASTSVSVGLNQMSLSVSDFKRVDNTVLSSWERAKILGFGSGQAFKIDATSWSGTIPEFADIAWSGGVRTLEGGVSTTWLDSYGLPRSHDALLQDSDSDGQRNGDEHEAGTNPVDSGSVFKVESSTVVGGDFLLRWQAVAGKTYAVDYKENLMDDDWTELDSGISGIEPTTQLDIELDSEQTACFFRVRVE